MDPEAAAKFQELMEMLKKAMMDSFFKDLYSQIANMSPEDMARMKEMISDLNEMLSEKMAGGEPDFNGFMQKYGDLFGDNPPQNLDELIEQMTAGIAAMQSLLDSLPPEMRRQLQDLLMDKVGDPDLQRELQELQINLDILCAVAGHAEPVPLPRRRGARPAAGDGPDGRPAGHGRTGDASSSARSTAATWTTSTRRSCAELLGEEAAEHAEAAEGLPAGAGGRGLHPPQGQQLGADAARRPQDRREGARRDLHAAQEVRLRQAPAAGQGPRRRARRRDEALRVRRPVPPEPGRDDHERHLPRRPAGARPPAAGTTSRSTARRR